MRTDLSKSLKLNCGESGCLKGDTKKKKKEQAVCCVNAAGDTAHRKAETTHSAANHAVKKF